MHGWWMFGTSKVKGMGGLLVSLGCWTIERWKEWNAFCWRFKQRGFIGMRKIGCFEHLRDVGNFQLNPYTLFWSLEILLCSHGVSFGDLVHHLKWLFSCGKQLGGKPLLWIKSRGGCSLWQIDVSFATLKKKLLITFFFIVQRRGVLWQLLFSLFGVS